MLVGSILRSNTSGSTTILHSIDLVSEFITSAHTTLNTTVGQKSSKDNILDIILTQQKVKVGRLKSAKAALTLTNNIIRGWLHQITDFSSPLPLFEELAFLDASKDSIRRFGNSLVTLW
jgi:hypothetical protein